MNNIINLRLARSMECGWENEHGHRHWFESPIPYLTYIGTRAHSKRRPETCDTWVFFVSVKFAAHQVEIFYGERAYKLWSEWKAIQFSKTKSKHNKTKKQNGNDTTTKRNTSKRKSRFKLKPTEPVEPQLTFKFND